jgi:transcription elongation factor Elf1
MDNICPKCGAETTCDEVDIGVGVQKGPARCDNCRWSQQAEFEKLFPELARYKGEDIT